MSVHVQDRGNFFFLHIFSPQLIGSMDMAPMGSEGQQYMGDACFVGEKGSEPVR